MCDCKLLGETQATSAERYFLEKTTDTDWWIRACALEALSEIGMLRGGYARVLH